MGELSESATTRDQSIAKLLKLCFLVLSALGIVLACVYIFQFSFGGEALIDTGYYFLLVALCLSSAFLILPAHKKGRGKGAPWYDLLLAAISFGVPFYFFLHGWEISQIGWSPPSPLNLALAVILCLLVLEAGRRMGGPIFLIVALLLGVYPLFASHLPGMLYGQSFPFNWLIAYYTFTPQGLIGLPLQVIGEILIGFLIFAAFILASGAGRFFTNFALALLGRFRGGPAKVAVLSSGFFGSLSGSVFSNIVATGSFTIPTMKRLGYSPHYAGAIEACASTGGSLMPPVMGTVAFVMCVFLSMDYSVVIAAAAIPAILYYFGLLIQVDAHAARIGLAGLPRESLPPLKKTLREGWPFIAVIFFLVWGLVYMQWAAKTPFYAAGLMFLLSFLNKETMMTPRKILEAIAGTGRLLAQTIAIILPIGFILGGLMSTGTSTALTSTFISLGGENVFLILIVGVVACYILGMAGMMTAAYVFLAVSLAPAVLALAPLNVLAVHLFIIYYAILAAITLPVAPGAFVAAAMAGASPMRTALQAMRLGVVIYIVPFFFVFNPSLILQGSILEALYLFLFCLLGILFIGAGLEGYLVKVGKLRLFARPPLAVAGILIAFPEWKTTIVGVALALLIIGMRWTPKFRQLIMKESPAPTIVQN